MDNPAPILGIDPGIGATGYAVVAHVSGGWVLVQSGQIRTHLQHPFPKRLKQIFDAVLKVISESSPSCLALEGTFLAKNFQSALKLGQAKGVVLLAAECSNLPVFEYSPTAVKMAVVGYGRASKEQLQRMVGYLLHLSTPLASDHEADAAAIAICHAHTTNAFRPNERHP